MIISLAIIVMLETSFTDQLYNRDNVYEKNFSVFWSKASTRGLKGSLYKPEYKKYRRMHNIVSTGIANNVDKIRETSLIADIQRSIHSRNALKYLRASCRGRYCEYILSVKPNIDEYNEEKIVQEINNVNRRQCDESKCTTDIIMSTKSNVNSGVSVLVYFSPFYLQRFK